MSQYPKPPATPLTTFRRPFSRGSDTFDSEMTGEYEDESSKKSPEERAFVRKIDLMLMPIICTINFMQYLDKTAINYAAVLDFTEDLHMSRGQFSILASMFYVGYLAVQVPNNYFLQRFPVGKYIGTIVITWGMLVFCSGFAQTFSQMTALRFLLGFCEGGIYPALTLLVSTFYRRKEQATRLGCVWLCNGLAVVIGGLAAFGIGNMDNLGVAPWRWIMFIFGAITCLVGAIAFFFLIDSPKSRYLHLNAEKEILVEDRTRDNAVVRTTVIKTAHMREALSETRLWAFCIASFLFNLRNGGMTIYLVQITRSFGYSKLASILLTVPIGLGAVPTYLLLLASISNNVSGYTKKIFYNGVIMIAYTLGNCIGPFVMAHEFAPEYIGSFIVYTCTSALGIICLLVARWRMALVNRQRMMRVHDTVTNVEDDITDAQDPNFIYRL
ncbi:hypothetical protein EC973_007561 [Apophysomyces ossiformis]|uniref:Major facilitator superfamily (MFS) profile domain-containing protein n=1 Tax=Apophysomyces ossiformis TaxID=679940 RepID=A0A8H7BM20_9FUNG|nr:hypothetical protein EC973_007561 [Apophysomyces ossiformis]